MHKLPINFPDPPSGPSMWRALLLIVAHDGYSAVSKWIHAQVLARWEELYPGMMFPDEKGSINPVEEL